MNAYTAYKLGHNLGQLKLEVQELFEIAGLGKGEHQKRVQELISSLELDLYFLVNVKEEEKENG